MKSIVSYEDRGKWGDSKWRGNCSGHLIVDLCNHFQPRNFVDICEGSGTSGDVCRELDINYTGLDLHKGFDFTKDSVLEAVGHHSDLVWSHPPYHDMIKYSGHVWGDQRLEGDTSNCHNYEEFLEKSQLMLLNQRDATNNNGIYTTLIGDMRRKGQYYPMQSDLIKLLPSNELLSIVIKQQNNHLSSFKSYNGKFIPILHEYLIIWKRKSKSLISVSYDKARELKQNISMTWRNLIRIALGKLKGKDRLSNIYLEVEKIAGEKLASNKHWKAKVRQTLQQHFTSVERGVWALPLTS